MEEYSFVALVVEFMNVCLTAGLEAQVQNPHRFLVRLNYLDLTKKNYVCNFKRFKLHTSIYFISLSDELNLLFCLLLYLF